LSSTASHAVANTRRAQFLTIESDYKKEIAKALVVGKIKNQRATLQYFYKLNPTVIKSYNRDIGALRFIYKEMQDFCSFNSKINALDLLLFTIDIATYLNAEQIKDVLGINNYKNDGLSLYESKININVEAKLKVGNIYE
jgi:hypothetical protein